MSRRNIKFCQNLILTVLITAMLGMHHLSQKSNLAKMSAVGKKIAVSPSLKDCLKANASPELREAAKGITAPAGHENSKTSLLAHYKSILGKLSPGSYQDVYTTLDECGLGIFAND